MSRQLPPFAAVRAFEAVARHLSVKMAADELCLSPSAVSHQIRALEDYFDTALFVRQGNGMELTFTGRSYAGKMTTLLNAFDEGTRQVRDVSNRPFQVICTPSFAARWLVPRLDRLSFGSRVRMQVSEPDASPNIDFASNDADLVIQWSDDPIPGVVTEPLMAAGRYPVISPELKERENVWVPEDLLRVPLIHTDTCDLWSEWFDAAKIDPPVFPRGPTFPNCELTATAAERGQGVAMAFDSVLKNTLDAGHLVPLFDYVELPSVIYSLAYPESRRDDSMIREFSSWIHAEAASEGVGPGRVQEETSSGDASGSYSTSFSRGRKL